MLSKNIVLIGFMGTGKTSIGKILAGKMARPLVDVDAFIENQEKRKISKIFEADGEAHFRKIESAVIEQMAGLSGMVITTGGGAVLDEKNRKALRRNSIVVALEAKPETIYSRVKDSGHRPLLRGGNVLDEIRKLLSERKSFYEECDFVIHTDDQSPKESADKIIEELKARFDYTR